MYIANNKQYSDAGKILIGKNMIGYAFPFATEIVAEEEIIIDDMIIENNEFIVYHNGKIRQRYYPNYDYADWKTAIIKQRYSNDDQIAIMLNFETDSDSYQRMQSWREWASVLSHKIINLKSN